MQGNMKPNPVHPNRGKGRSPTPFTRACLASCKTVLSRMERAKEAIFMEACLVLGAQERLLRLALNEAEAAAWETMYPHLVFPALASEKAQAVAAWNAHQQSVRRNSPIAATE